MYQVLMIFIKKTQLLSIIYDNPGFYYCGNNNGSMFPTTQYQLSYFLFALFCAGC